MCPACFHEGALHPRAHKLGCPVGQRLREAVETLMETHGWPATYAAHVVKRRCERSLLPLLAAQRDALLAPALPLNPPEVSGV